MQPDLSITIDGPTASGKTTLGMRLSRILRSSFFDTGLTFRALSYALNRHDLAPSDDWPRIVDHTPLAHTDESVTPEVVRLHGEEVTSDIFAPELEGCLATIASCPQWRAGIRRFQKDIVKAHSRIVVVGRDTSVALLPKATLHVVLTADHAVRRDRRRAQYQDLPSRSAAVGPPSALDQQIADAIRAKSNSIVLDTTRLSAEAVESAVLHQLEKAAS